MGQVKRIPSIIIVVALLVSLSLPLTAYNLKIKPEIFHFSEVRVGKKFNFRKPLFIYNESDQPAVFTLESVKPSAIKSTWIKGYEEIPDTSWFGFESREIRIPANSTMNVLLNVNIPKEKKYYNQHYVLALAIRLKLENGQATSKRFIYPLVYLETEVKKWMKESPAGKTAVSPSVLVPRELKQGKNKARDSYQVTIFNNSSNRKTYTITPTAELAFGKKQPIRLQGDYQWLPHPEWLKTKKKISIGPGAGKTISIDFDFPEDESLRLKNYESILYIQDESGSLSFVRVHMRIH